MNDTVAAVKTRFSRVDVAFAILVVLSCVAVLLNTRAAHSVLTAQGAAISAAVIAFVKARFIVTDFMNLRGTAWKCAFDAWIFLVGATSIVLLMR